MFDIFPNHQDKQKLHEKSDDLLFFCSFHGNMILPEAIKTINKQAMLINVMKTRNN